jgi:cation:H+ antiporter
VRLCNFPRESCRVFLNSKLAIKTKGENMDAFILNFLEHLPTIGIIMIFLFTLFTLSKGADILVDQAVCLSIRWGIPKLIIGATIVSLGTTLPEATVSVFAAIKGNPALALGNAVGSIIADTGLIIGIAAIIGRLPVDKNTIDKQGKVQFFSGLLLVLISLPFFSNLETGVIHQWMGWLLVILLIAYIFLSIKWAKNNNSEEATNSEEESEKIFSQIFKLLIGVSLVIISSKILIPSVEITALRIGIPQSVIAATLVAFGTSLPELITAVTAVRKGHGELAVGNIIGADILNVLFVVGLSASVTKGGLLVPVDFYKLQFPAMMIILTAFRIFAKNTDDVISKKEGIFLAGIYFIYIILNYTWI